MQSLSLLCRCCLFSMGSIICRYRYSSLRFQYHCSPRCPLLALLASLFIFPFFYDLRTHFPTESCRNRPGRREETSNHSFGFKKCQKLCVKPLLWNRVTSQPRRKRKVNGT